MFSFIITTADIILYLLVYMEGSNPLDKIPKVTISPKGIFKYILITGDMEYKGDKSEVCFMRGS